MKIDENTEEIEEVTEETISSEEEVIEGLRNRYLLLSAEMENLRKTQAKEKIDTMKYCLSSFLYDFIPSLEMFENALASSNISPEIKNWLVGFEMIFDNMNQALEKKQVMKIITNKNDVFNSKLHESIGEDFSDEIVENNILEVKQNGYTLHGRLIKPSSVVVSKGRKNKEN